MNKYLKNIFIAILTAELFSVSAQAQIDASQALPDAIPAQQQTGSQTSLAAPAPPAQTQATVSQNAPVQAETVQTDHSQKPADIHYYNYAHDEAEYSVSLPEAPTVSTIWQESPETKAFLKQPPTDHAALGEVATYKLVDLDTEEMFDVQILFLRATPSFLQGLTDDKIKRMLTKKFGEVPLSGENFTVSNGASTLKWAQLSGFVLDAHHHPAFYAIHYLTGLQSILVVQAKYSIENKTFQEYYNHMISSITYVQP